MRPGLIALILALLFAGSVAASANASVTVNDTVTGATPGTFAYAGTWSTSTGAAKYLGNDHYSQTTGSSYTFRFSGSQLALYGAKASHHGQASVQIDGGSAVTIDQYASTRQDNVLIYQSPVLTAAVHSVRVTVRGTHQTASTGNVIAIDRAVYSSPPAPCPDTVSEPDDTPAQAQPLAAPSTTTRAICVPGDVDWVKFSGVAGHSYRLQTSNLGPGMDSVISLYADGGDTFILSDDDGGGGLNSYADFSPTISAVYWLRIVNYNGASGSSDARYDLSISETYAVSVSKSGTGVGTVSSQPDAINCGETCSARFSGNTSVTLTAAAAPGSAFAGWGGACSGTATTCVRAVNSNLSVTASFRATSITVDDRVIGTTSNTFAYAGAWSSSFGAEKYLETDTYSLATGSNYTFRFSGTQVALYGAKASHHGQALVQIDGGTAVTIDQYASTRQDNVLIYQSPALTAGAHTVKVTVKGTRHTASSGYVVAIDRAVVAL